MNIGKIMEAVGFSILVGAFIYALYRDYAYDISLNESFGYNSLPYLLGMLLWSLGYIINPDRKKKKEES